MQDSVLDPCVCVYVLFKEDMQKYTSSYEGIFLFLFKYATMHMYYLVIIRSKKSKVSIFVILKYKTDLKQNFGKML